MTTQYYLDANATSPLHPAARQAVMDALDMANPMSPHAAGRAARMVIDHAREQIAALVGRDAREVCFTSGATEANAWALQGLISDERPLVVTSAVEHPSALSWADQTLPVDRHGVVCMDSLDALLSRDGERIAVVSVMAANNETGVLQPIEAIQQRLAGTGIWLHCDATQLPGRLPVDVPADLITISAHKFGGPKGVGALISRVAPKPLLRGGSQERALRSGTHNVAGIAGMAAAAAHCSQMNPSARDALAKICEQAGGRILGRDVPRLPNTLTVLFDQPGDLVVMALDLAGVAASTGSACSSGAAEKSHVLAAMGEEGIPVRMSLYPGQDITPVLPIVERVLSNMEAACAW